jgi:hypothetical protein
VTPCYNRIATMRQENRYTGKAEFYRYSYGPYLIDMNSTAHKTFESQAGTRCA